MFIVTEKEKKFLKVQTSSFKPINKLYLKKLIVFDDIPTDNKLLCYISNSDTVKCFDVDAITVLNLIQVSKCTFI